MNAGSIKSIKALVLDIDGVLTDGTVEVSGRSVKRVFLRDLDALALLRKAGIAVAFLTGESEADARPVVERCGGAGLALCPAEAVDLILERNGMTDKQKRS